MSGEQYSVNSICQIVKGKLIKGNKSEFLIITDILIDSRQLITAESTLFFALITPRNNGHKYIFELYEKGIRAFVVSQLPGNKNSMPEATFILVKHTLSALQQLTAHHRSRYNIPVIGITGSNGKTIVKEWLFQLLSPGKNIVRSPKSYNSQIGVPLSVWQMGSGHEVAIFEAGISEPDEMDKLQPIIRPTLGIYTNVGQAHDENFIQTAQKAGEKLKLFTKVDTLIYCSDHSDIQEVFIKSGLSRQISTFTWGIKNEADLMILSVTTSGGTSMIEASNQGNPISIRIPFTDAASVENAIHCWSVMLLMGYGQEIINERMAQLSPIAMRLELKEGINNCTIVNDFYNSDFNSLRIALDFLNQQNQHREKTVILSDILQSGRSEVELYTDIGALLEAKSINRLIGIGQAMSRQQDKFAMNREFFETTEDFLNHFAIASLSNQSVLLKGARKFEFERISNLLQQKAHETVLEINLNHLVSNLNFYKSKLRPETRLMAMVKAFGYGSGSFEIANVLQFHQVDYLAVAYADEGVELRKAGIETPIMVMSPEENSFDAMIRHRLEPEIFSFRILGLLEETISQTPLPSNKPVKIHIKLDTGMYRLGFCEHELDELSNRLINNNMLFVQSVFSHLAASDKPEHDQFTNMQIETFRRMSDRIISLFPHPVYRHILNSAGISRFPEARFEMVRLGIGLYGVAGDSTENQGLSTVISLKSTISQIKTVQENHSVGYNRSFIADKPVRIGIVPIGYADGLSRNLGNGRGKLYIQDKAASIVGDVCMDMCMINLNDIDAHEGDTVVVFDENHPVSKIARDSDTIPYEIFTSISRRVKRVYFYE
jgi:Alr-MurF fusion protein